MNGVVDKQSFGSAILILDAQEDELGVHGAVGDAFEVVEQGAGAAVIAHQQAVVAELDFASADGQASGE